MKLCNQFLFAGMVGILLPYELIEDRDILYTRRCINVGAPAGYITFNPPPYGMPVSFGRWKITNYYLNNILPLFSSKEEAMEILDKLLIQYGFKLLKTKEEADKYRVLL